MSGKVGEGQKAIPGFEREKSRCFRPWARGLSEMRGGVRAALGKEMTIPGNQNGVSTSAPDQPSDACKAGFSRSPNRRLVTVLWLRWGNMEQILAPLGQMAADWMIIALKLVGRSQGEDRSLGLSRKALWGSTFFVNWWGLGIQWKAGKILPCPCGV